MFGSSLELPTAFFLPFKPDIDDATVPFVDKLFSTVQTFPKPTRQHPTHYYVPKDLRRASHVWVLDPSPQHSLSPRYSGPHKILSLRDKVAEIQFDDRIDTVSIDRIKPAYLMKTEVVPSEFDNANLTMETPDTSTDYPVNEVVLATRRGLPKWPAVVVDPNETPLQHQRCPKDAIPLRYFGTRVFTYVHRRLISPFIEVSTNLGSLRTAIALAKDFSLALAERGNCTSDRIPKVTFASKHFICI